MTYSKLLELDGGLRYSTYAGSLGARFTSTTYKVGLQWSPTEDIRFRGSYQRAIRAPNIIELFNPNTVTQSNQFGANGDPCAGAVPLFTAAQCAFTGVTAAQYGHITQCIADQCNVLLGGNPKLKPETADTFSAGATFTPHQVRGLTFSVDWWDIMQYGFIGAVPPNIIVTQCANGAA